MFFKFSEEMRQIFKSDVDKHNVIAWYIYNTNYQAKEYNGLEEGECFSSISVISKETGINESKVKRILKALESEGLIEYTYKSKSKYNTSKIKCKFAQKSEPVNKPVSEPVNDTVQSVGITALQVVDKTVDEPVNKLVSGQYSINKSINKSKYISIVVNSDQLELINNKCCITGEITEQQQREIKNMNIKILEEVIEKCNSYKSSYNINYLLQAYRNISPWAEIRSHKGAYSEEPHKNKKSMSERLGVENLNHYSKYDDLEDRLLKRQEKKRANL